MFGFLSKLVLMGAVLAAIGGVIYLRRGSIPNPQSLVSDAKVALTQVDTKTVLSNISASLDNLVTNPQPNSPVVLGLHVTNESLSTIVDVIQNLPPDQVAAITTALCEPASPSAR